MAYENEIEVKEDAAPAKGKKALTCERSADDFKLAYKAKRVLIERQKEDFLFRLGKQWKDEDLKNNEARGIKCVTDNRIQPNIFLLTGLERQNRSEWKAYPEGQEDSLKAAVASNLLKDTIKKSDFGYKGSEAFEDGITCGESALEMYLDFTTSLLNGKPCWKKIDSNQVFPQPGWKEYDYSDAAYVYKLTKGLSEDDLITLFPEKRTQIERTDGAKFDIGTLMADEENHRQPKDYGKSGDKIGDETEEKVFDLLERYYKKFVEKASIGDRETGEINPAESKEKAEAFIAAYQKGIADELAQYQQNLAEYQAVPVDPMLDPMAGVSDMGMDPMAVPMAPQPPQEPIKKNPDRFKLILENAPEIWYFAHAPGMNEPLADERAWFYPKWKAWPIIPYFAHFTNAPIDGEDSHLKIQGLVHGVKNAQELHNKAETIKLAHMHSSASGGWLTPKGAWTDEDKVRDFGTMPGVNLEYDPAKGKPERIFPMPAQTAWERDSEFRAESIKAQLGINADLLATQEGGTDSGRAIALRQKQGVIMVQKLFDNFARTKQICGRMALTQLGDIYDTESAKKVLGDAFLKNNFPTPTQVVTDDMGMASEQPQTDEMGQPLPYDIELADMVLKDVLGGDLGMYDVSIGEVVASDTMLMAQALEMKELAQIFPMAFTPDMVIEASNLPDSLKSRAIGNAQRAQAMMAGPMPGQPQPSAA
jgi:hypothetical protein